MKIEIMDTTLRDGEQTSGVSFAPEEKLSLARLLLTDIEVDRIEIASARVSEGERSAVIKVMEWAARNGHLDRVEVLGFVDNGTSLNWIAQSGGRVINLLTKGSAKHCKYQLRKTPTEHIDEIKRDLAMARGMGIKANIYLEDWSNGMISSPQYVYDMVDALHDEPIERFMLPDTLGVLEPEQCYTFCRAMVERYPALRFDFHAHNDYDLAVANTMAAIRAGITAVHVTVNGLGERAGNTPLSSLLAVLHDHLKVEANAKEGRLSHISSIVESYSGIRIPANKPVIGESVFTQCAGIHADGDNKNNLYYNDLLPERFGRIRSYALGKSSGKANIRKNLEVLGIELTEEAMGRLTQYIVELGDKKEVVTTDDLPYIISDLLGESEQQSVRILNYSLSLAQGLRPVATVKMQIHDQTYQQTATGDGQYDAFVGAVRAIYKVQLGREFPRLVDYSVNIPPGGRTDAFVQTIITWEGADGYSFKTRGLDADQTIAAIKATVKMLNKIENNASI